MNTQAQKTLGLTITITGIPSNVEEFDALAKEDGGCLQYAIENVIYRSWLAGFRSAFISLCELKTGIARYTEGEGDELKISEKDTSYLKRLREVEETPESDLQAWAQELADVRPFAVNPVSVSKVGKKYMEAAAGIIDTAETDFDGDYTKFIENITKSNPGVVFAFDVDGKPSKETIAVALRVNEERLLREQSKGHFA